MGHEHSVLDTDTRFIINPITRQIVNDTNRKITLIQGDHNSEIFGFSIPRYVEKHDMSLCNVVEIHYFNVSTATQEKESGIYTVQDLQIDPGNEENVIFSWLISNGATTLEGALHFLVRFKCVENDGTVSYAWNTGFFNNMMVSKGSDADVIFEEKYVDIIEQWKASVLQMFEDEFTDFKSNTELELSNDLNRWKANTDENLKEWKNQTETDLEGWKKEEETEIQQLFGDYESYWQNQIEVERARIDQFTKLEEGSTTGDAELMDLRVGADGETYENAGEAVRTQIKKLDSLAESGAGTGMTEETIIYINHQTKVGIEDCTTQGATPSQAYGNGTIFNKNVRLTGIKMLETITATSFSLFVFDDSDKLVSSAINIVPTITNGEFDLDEPLLVPIGGYVLMRFLDGVFFYKNIGESTLKEYQPGTGTLIDSPIKIGVEYIYDEIHQTVVFKKETILPSIQLQDYLMPRFTANHIEECTFFGRWFEYVKEDKTYKATNADGSSIAFKVSGATKLNIGLYPITEPDYPPYYAYSVDGGEFIRKAITDTTIPLEDNGEHWVWIAIDGMGENDPIPGGKWYGSVGVYFAGVTTDGTINGVNVSNKQIMFIGDSIVEGINVLGAGANAEVNSATNGFAFKTARMLNAIPLLCGYGGTAVLGNSSFHKPIEAIDFNIVNTPVNEQYPDIICIEHGYNDGTLVSTGVYTANDFEEGYNALLDRIKTKYPGIPIVCMIPFKQSLRKEIIECTAERKYCYVVETENWGISYTDEAHPNTYGSNRAAEKLSESLTKIFGKQYFM